MNVPAHFQLYAKEAERSLVQLKQDFMGIRSSRVSPQMLERVRVSAYGSDMPVQQVASVSSLDARTLEVRPWDPQVLGEIEKAIHKSDLGVVPSGDGSVLRLSFPPLTENRRKDYVRVAKQFGEEARVRVRNARREALAEAVDGPAKEKKIPEDEKFRRQQELDRLTAKYIADIDAMLAAKERDILEI